MAVFNYVTGVTHWTKVLGDPHPNFNRDGREWTFDFTPDADGLKLFAELGITDKLKDKSDERGKFIQFKQKEKQADGKANFPITVVDAGNKPWDPEIKIGNGSIIEVKFKVADYGKGKPKGVYPQAIRVLELRPYVRQEFAPLPDDNKYLKQYESFMEAGDDIIADGIVEGDPLE